MLKYLMEKELEAITGTAQKAGKAISDALVPPDDSDAKFDALANNICCSR